MPLKQAILSKASSGLQCYICSHSLAYATSTSPSVFPIPRARSSTSDSKKRKMVSPQKHSYATVRGPKKSYDFRDNMNWPCHKADSDHSSIPSPYDIFEIEKDGAYSKHKFYELVKMYHPDRHSHHSGIPDHPIASLPQVECVERYRLVVQAHEILSDPVKRKAYDAWGAGWGEQATKTYTGTSATPRYSPRDEDSPFGNATWEDWERWYARTSDQHHHARPGTQASEGIYFNPNAFAFFVIVVAVLSGVLQATHAGQYSGSIEERAAAFTAQTHQFMTGRKQDNIEYSSTGFSGHGFHGNAPKMGTLVDGRIRHFLQRRDPNRHGLKDEEQEMYRKHFAGQPLPVSAGVKKGATDTKTDSG